MTLVLIILAVLWTAVLVPPMIQATKEKRDPSYRSQKAPDPLERPPVIRGGTVGWFLRLFVDDEPTRYDGDGRGRFRGFGGGGGWGGGGGCGGGDGGGC